MSNFIRNSGLRLTLAASCLFLTTAHAQDAYDIMSGRMFGTVRYAFLR